MRRVCVVVGSRANYSSIKSVMRAVQAHPELELVLVVGASALLDRYGAVSDIIERDGFTPNARVHMILEGESLLTMAKSTGLGLLELPNVFESLKPDVVVTVGDRFETMATAIAAAYMNIPLAHTMGGEVTGTIDESVRHAVTKLSHIHFPASKDAGERIIRMGESPDTVHVVGCPRIDLVAEIARTNGNLMDTEWLQHEGVGADIELNEPFLIVSQHPVTTEYGQGEAQITETLHAVLSLDVPSIVLWPNADAGSEDIARGMRKFRETHKPRRMRFYKNLPIETFVGLTLHAGCMVGNSSAPIREGSYLGVPAVNIGTRQQGRERGGNVIDAAHDREDIRTAVLKQLEHRRYPPDHVYGDGHAGDRVAAVLARAPLTVQKRIQY